MSESIIPADVRVACGIYDHLLAEGVTLANAAGLARAASDLLSDGPALAALYIVRRVGDDGEPLAAVTPAPAPGDVPLWRFDIRRLRRAARERIAEEFELDAAAQYAGTAL